VYSNASFNQEEKEAIMRRKSTGAAWSLPLLPLAVVCGTGICLMGFLGAALYPIKDRFRKGLQ
jgi:hypothetical protein